jgi:hypothetical protein
MLFLFIGYYLVAWQSAAYHEDLKDCIKWHLKVEKDHLFQVESLQNLLNAAEKKCADTGNSVGLLLELSATVV